MSFDLRVTSQCVLKTSEILWNGLRYINQHIPHYLNWGGKEFPITKIKKWYFQEVKIIVGKKVKK